MRSTAEPVGPGPAGGAPRGAEPARLVRYAVSGGASALTHVGVGLAGLRLLHLGPVTASTTGFTASVVVSYLLQRAWVFRCAAGHVVAGPRFLAVTAAAAVVNTVVLWLGAGVLAAPYPVAQAFALALIPLVNYVLNARWTFAGR
ncbi:GtrA family protein [Actinoplanes teichomyceticus]|uniref:Putative flippase GtrA n=1 Tax=Actinoplanes teichomyceticus TaxID=1867 RepID=A0A561WNG5_ACTTI|nr:GtrA family protein [Actinoplanes teichomyceticus]TWG25399.1 putative flippase GtrA [Actinoplanes teichomyceticus]GIF10466.1 hypothetical protein Ate01nite_04980 [Actinoplanes teichomyceticus]